MRIWTVVVGEPSPVDGAGVRLYRKGILSLVLARRGHQVTWFNGTVDHVAKKQRFEQSCVMDGAEGQKMAFLYGRLYARNISLSRIGNHRDVAKSFLKLAQTLEKPDVIVCSYPPFELAAAVAAYARANNVPYVMDYRDQWPDIFADLLPQFLRPLANILMAPWYLSARRSARFAAGLVGITQPFLDWALGFAGRAQGTSDRVFHLASSPDEVVAGDMEAARQYWDAQGITGDRLTLVFSGTLSLRMDLETLVEGALLLPASVRQKIRIVICGKGEIEETLKARARGAEHVLFAGWRNQAELKALMERAHAGLLPYPSTQDFMMSYPNKVGEYLSASLPVITCLKGEVTRLVRTEGCGLLYREGDAQSFAACLTRMAEGLVDITAMKKIAGHVYARDFNARKIYDDYANYVESLTRRS